MHLSLVTPTLSHRYDTTQRKSSFWMVMDERERTVRAAPKEPTCWQMISFNHLKIDTHMKRLHITDPYLFTARKAQQPYEPQGLC